MKVVLDTSCLASFFLMDRHYPRARRIVEKVVAREVDGLLSALSMPELCGVIRRQADRQTAHDVKENVAGLVEKGIVIIVPLTVAESQKAGGLAIETGLKGADAVVVQAARKAGALLCTLDEEIVRKAKGLVEFYRV